MMVLSSLLRTKIIQVPVNYTRRVGKSSVTGDKRVAFLLGLRMILLILDYRLRSWFAPAQFESPRTRLSDLAFPSVDLVTEVDLEEEKER